MLTLRGKAMKLLSGDCHYILSTTFWNVLRALRHGRKNVKQNKVCRLFVVRAQWRLRQDMIDMFISKNSVQNVRTKLKTLLPLLRFSVTILYKWPKHNPCKIIIRNLKTIVMFHKICTTISIVLSSDVTTLYIFYEFVPNQVETVWKLNTKILSKICASSETVY